MASDLNLGEILISVAFFLIVFVVVVWSSFGVWKPSLLYRSIVLQSSIPESRRPGFWQRIFCSCCGYTIDFQSYREEIQALRQVEERMRSDEQIRYLEQLVVTELQLQEQIAQMESNGTRVDGSEEQRALRQLQRYRYAAAVRTRQERRRRHLEGFPIFTAVTGQHEEEREPHFKESLSHEEKREVLMAALSSYSYQAVLKGSITKIQHSSMGEKKIIDDGRVDSKGKSATGAKPTSAGTRDDCLHTQATEDKKDSSLTKDEEQGLVFPQGSDIEPKDGLTTSSLYLDKACSICLDDYVIGDSLCGRPGKCQHIFHTDCLMLWLERQDVCPICRTTLLSEEEWRQTSEHLGRVRNDTQEAEENLQTLDGTPE